MAGLSERFLNEGFILPKYMLYVKNKSLFHLAVSSFKNYFNKHKIIFIARDKFDTNLFILEECKKLGIINYDILILDQPTKGQAATVNIGIIHFRLNPEEPIFIFNIDTIRHNFIIPQNMIDFDGYLEVFKGSGDNWSFARTESTESTIVLETAEKISISDNCSTGLYYFKKARYFTDAYEISQNKYNLTRREQYIAPLYNYLIELGLSIHINLINSEDVIFSGIPAEFYDLNKTIDLEMYL
jgi:hypothetical protein